MSGSIETNIKRLDASMKIIQQNPYRVLGILSNVSQRELLRRRSKMRRFQSIGREITSDYDFVFFDAISRQNGIIESAFSKIERDENKVLHSLFWFSEGNTFDSIAIDNLKVGNKEKALGIWQRVIKNKSISDTNITSFNNLGTLYLLIDDQESIKEGVNLKVQILKSDNFLHFARMVSNDNYFKTGDEHIHLFLDELYNELEERYKNNLKWIFDIGDQQSLDYIVKKLSKGAIFSIESALKKTAQNRGNNKLSAYQYGKELKMKVAEDLSYLRSVLGENDLQYRLLADNVAKELLQCAIDYFNSNDESYSDEDYLENAMKLANEAKAFAVNDLTKDRIADNINTLEDMRDRELDRALDILRSVKEAYEKNHREITKMAEQKASSILFTLSGRTIDWVKVQEIIQDSIDWEKVVRIIYEDISPEHIEIIKKSDNDSKVQIYKSLVKYLFDKMFWPLK